MVVVVTGSSTVIALFGTGSRVGLARAGGGGGWPRYRATAIFRNTVHRPPRLELVGDKGGHPSSFPCYKY